MIGVEQAREAKDALQRRLHRPAWLRGIGIGIDQQGSHVVRVMVAAMSEEVRSRVPPQVEGVPVEVDVTGDFYPLGASSLVPHAIAQAARAMGLGPVQGQVQGLVQGLVQGSAGAGGRVLVDTERGIYAVRDGGILRRMAEKELARAAAKGMIGVSAEFEYAQMPVVAYVRTPPHFVVETRVSR